MAIGRLTDHFFHRTVIGDVPGELDDFEEYIEIYTRSIKSAQMNLHSAVTHQHCVQNSEGQIQDRRRGYWSLNAGGNFSRPTFWYSGGRLTTVPLENGQFTSPMIVM